MYRLFREYNNNNNNNNNNNIVKSIIENVWLFDYMVCMILFFWTDIFY